jgi:hypothetical protein
MIHFSDKYFGLIYTGQGRLEGNTTVCRQWEALSIIPSIYLLDIVHVLIIVAL